MGHRSGPGEGLAGVGAGATATHAVRCRAGIAGDVPPLQPGEAWTPERAAAFVAKHDVDVSAEVVRLEQEMGEALPHGTLFTYRYTAESLMRGYPRRAPELDGQLLGFVQVRTSSGAIHSATVHVAFANGAVEVRGWPLEVGRGWVPG